VCVFCVFLCCPGFADIFVASNQHCSHTATARAHMSSADALDDRLPRICSHLPVPQRASAYVEHMSCANILERRLSIAQLAWRAVAVPTHTGTLSRQLTNPAAQLHWVREGLSIAQLD
jgi:hypothetical protein